MDIKKVIQNNIITIILWMAGVVFAGFNIYIASQLAPLAKDLAVLGTKVEAMEKAEPSYIHQAEFNQVIQRLDKISGRVDQITTILINK